MHLVDPRNTSRTCSACGHCAKENRKSQAIFCCVNCGMTMNADINAAINISWASVMVPMVGPERRRNNRRLGEGHLQAPRL
ncbi:MAG: zinc ribbon domain-containing protein [Ktedonobacteraceae bacterium]